MSRWREDDYDPRFVIMGRPDLENGNRGRYGITRAKKHPPYVFSISNNSALIHKIDYVELRWWRAASIRSSGDCLKRLHKPAMLAKTVCGMTKFLEAGRSRTCILPRPDAIRCGKCHGQPAPFGKEGWCTKAEVSRSEAHVKLGCIVNGY